MINTVLIAVVVFLIFSSWFFRETKNYPTGPFRWPVFGNLSLLKKLSRTFGGQHCAFVELLRRYGSDVISLRLGASNVIVVSGQIGIQKVLHSEEYDGRPWNEFIKLRNFGNRNGLTMIDGPEWREMRTWVVRKLRIIGMGRRQMSDLMMEELNEILKTIKGGGIHRLKQIITPAVINVLWSLVTGKRFCDKHSYRLHLTVKLAFILPTTHRDARTVRMRGMVVTVIHCWISSKKEPLAKQYTKALVSQSEYFIDLMERRGRAFDMSGGVLSALPWIRHIAPERSGYNLLVTINCGMKKFLMETIDDHKRKYTPDMQDDLIYTVLTIRLAYTEAVLAESQRMCSVAPIIGPRQVLQETNLLGYIIPKESTVLVNVWSTHMNEDFYPEPESFKPERFLKNGLYVPNENLILFGEGKRRCPGETLARCGLFLLFVGVMQQYHLLPVPGQEPPTLARVPGLIISPRPYDVLLTPRLAEPRSFDSPN